MASTATATVSEAPEMTLGELEKIAKQANIGEVTFVVARSGSTVFVRRDKPLAPSRHYEFNSFASAAEFLIGYND